MEARKNYRSLKTNKAFSADPISCNIRPEGKLGTNVKNLGFVNLYSCMLGEKGIVGVGAVVTMDVLPGTIVAIVPVSILRRI